jgi:hypothetical protein
MSDQRSSSIEIDKELATVLPFRPVGRGQNPQRHQIDQGHDGSIQTSRQPGIRPTSSLRPPEHGHQFGDLGALLRLVAARDRVLDAMRDVIPQDFFLGAAQGGTHRRDLRDDVDAVAILVDHARQAANLTFDAAETFFDRRLDVFLHAG